MVSLEPTPAQLERLAMVKDGESRLPLSNFPDYEGRLRGEWLRVVTVLNQTEENKDGMG